MRTTFALSESWRATVPPLASIIGSGFLVSGPLLARELGQLALFAMVREHALIAEASVTLVIAGIAMLALAGGLKRVEQLAHGSVAIRIGIIAGMLAALAAHRALHGAEPAPPSRSTLTVHQAQVVLGLLVTVQGFEISRYLGQSHVAELRIRTMRHAQWISTGIYLGFIALLTPVLGSASRSRGVAAILDLMHNIGWGLAPMVLLGAAFSQLSAAIADSIDSAGILIEVSGARLDAKVAFVVSSSLAVAVVWMSDPFQVIALASRAFALLYAIQCAAVPRWWRAPQSNDRVLAGAQGRLARISANDTCARRIPSCHAVRDFASSRATQNAIV